MLSINLDDVMQVLTNVRSYLHRVWRSSRSGDHCDGCGAEAAQSKKEDGSVHSLALAILLALTIVINTDLAPAPCPPCWTSFPAAAPSARRPLQRPRSWSMRSPQRASFWQRTRDNVLPVASGSKLNVFGWSSTNPCYGGTGFRCAEHRFTLSQIC